MPNPPHEVFAPGEGEKLCAKCAIVKPATGFYFHKDSTVEDGWCPMCKECRKAVRQAERNKEIEVGLKKVGVDLLGMIAAGNGRPLMPDIISGGEIVLGAFGGIEGLAQKLAHDYEGSAVGTAGRTKILLGVMQFVSRAMEQQQAISYSGMDEEQLRSELVRVLGSDARRLTAESEDESALGDSE